MKIILVQTVQLPDSRQGIARVKKYFESNIIPHKGDTIYDPVWKADNDEHNIVQEVMINYSDNECYVYLPIVKIEINDKKVLLDYVEMTKLHDWEVDYISN